MSQNTAGANVVLFGLGDVPRVELDRILPGQTRVVQGCFTTLAFLDAVLVLCAAERPEYRSLLQALRREKPELPVVVLSRCPEVREWVDAMEAGASYYCGLPLEPWDVRWILQAALASGRASWSGVADA
jgi:DNA-binding NtrC family response regulator